MKKIKKANRLIVGDCLEVLRWLPEDLVDYVEIPLTKGMKAIIDRKNLLRILRHRWSASLCSSAYYATANIKIGAKWTTIKMHRYILGIPVESDLEVDHINHNTLDNRASNLRLCNRAQNKANSRKRRDGRCKSKGVWQNKTGKKWIAQIQKRGKKIHLGTFESERDASRAYSEAAASLFGEFAYES